MGDDSEERRKRCVCVWESEIGETILFEAVGAVEGLFLGTNYEGRGHERRRGERA